MDISKLEEWISELHEINKKWFEREITKFQNFDNFNIQQIPLYEEDYLNRLPKYIKYYITQAPIYKLQYQKQLSYLDLFYLGGGHTRFEHVIGTVTLGSIILDLIEIRGLIELEDYEKGAFLTALLIHDCGQPPFGHSLEILKAFFIEKSILTLEKLDKLVLKSYLSDENDIFVNMLLEPWEQEEKKKNFLNLLRALFDYQKFISEYSDKCFLYQLLNSIIDCDRLDWIRRDQMHLEGFTSISFNEITSLFSKLKLLDVDRDPDKLNRLAFPDDIVNTIEIILLRRQKLYDKYYHGDFCRIFDNVFPNIIFRFLQDNELIIGNQDSEKISNYKREILDNFLKLPDFEFLNFIYKHNKKWYVNNDLRNLFLGNFPKVMKKWEIWKKVEKMNKETEDIFENFKNELKNTNNDREKQEKFKKKIIEYYGEGAAPLKIYLKFLCNFYVNSPTIIFELQSRFWRLLLEEIDDFEKEVENFIFKKKKKWEKKANNEFEDEVSYEIKKSQIFISIPPYVPEYESIKKASYSPKERRLDELDILIYSDENPPMSYEDNYMSRTQIQLGYSLLLIVPKYLFKFEKEILIKFEEFIRDLPWWELR